MNADLWCWDDFSFRLLLLLGHFWRKLMTKTYKIQCKSCIIRKSSIKFPYNATHFGTGESPRKRKYFLKCHLNEEQCEQQNGWVHLDPTKMFFECGVALGDATKSIFVNSISKIISQEFSFGLESESGTGPLSRSRLSLWRGKQWRFNYISMWYATERRDEKNFWNKMSINVYHLRKGWFSLENNH